MSRIAFLFVTTLLVVPQAHACTIPVFRYALERWELSAYEIVVFAKGPIGLDMKRWLRKLEAGPPVANVRVEIFDVADKLPKAYQAIWNQFGKGQSLPWVAVRHLDAEADTPLAYSGPVDEARLKAVIDSPLRQKLVHHLKKGVTAAFLVLESGDAAADTQAVAMLAKELARLEKAITLPEQSAEGPQLKTALPLKVSFAIERLRRDDVAEHGFLQTIFSTEDGLAKAKGPIVLPIFGRGRLLCSLYGKDLEPDQIATVVRFLCGECSCQVKELNPGVDLLIAADWPAIFEAIGPPTDARPDTPAPGKRKKQ